MAEIKLIIYFGDWNVCELVRWLPNEKDEHGLTYKKMLIRPDHQSILAIWGSQDEFEKFAVDKKLRPTTSGDFIIIKLWEEYFLPIFQYGDQNIQFVLCGFNGEDTVFTRHFNDNLRKIQNRDTEIEGLRAQVALAGERYNDLVKRKFSDTETMKDLVESISQIGSSRRKNPENFTEEDLQQGENNG